jgi:hypothetical protein
VPPVSRAPQDGRPETSASAGAASKKTTNGGGRRQGGKFATLAQRGSGEPSSLLYAANAVAALSLAALAFLELRRSREGRPAAERAVGAVAILLLVASVTPIMTPCGFLGDGDGGCALTH